MLTGILTLVEKAVVEIEVGGGVVGGLVVACVVDGAFVEVADPELLDRDDVPTEVVLDGGGIGDDELPVVPAQPVPLQLPPGGHTLHRVPRLHCTEGALQQTAPET
jgi:hypothetical protein